MADDPLVSRIEGSVRVALGMATGYVLDAARQIAAETGRPVMVIASRRQVDRPELGGGYVGWATPDWPARAGDTLLLARDHAGPFQHPGDFHPPADPQAAMASAVESLRCDIESGVELLHIDTSVGPDGTAETLPVAHERAVELVARCAGIAAAAGRRVAFEVGVELQSTVVSPPEEYAGQMRQLLADLAGACGVSPVFLVAQTGTKVVGTGNTGVIAQQPAPTSDRRRLHELGALVRSFGSRLKAHNCDYLAEHAIRALRAAGAWMNISPELGVAQTSAVLRAARSAGLDGVLDEFCDATIRAGYWHKWVGQGQTPSDTEKVLLGGSYLFSTPLFAELRERLDHALRAQDRSTRALAVQAVRQVAGRFLAEEPSPGHG